MNHIKHLLRARTLLGIAAFFFTIPAWAQLSGSYTIDPTQAASSTNYKDWSSAVSDLDKGTRSDGGTAQGKGVSGPVVFTVYDMVYKEQILFQSISGASSTNTITFKSKGGDSTKCVLTTASGTIGGSDYAMAFSGASFITIHQIGLERTGNNTYSTVVELSNSSSNITLSNCWLKGRKVPSNSTNGFAYGIGSIVQFTGTADKTLIENCKLIYGYNGIYGTSSGSGNRFVGNEIDTSGSSGIYMTSQTSLEIIGNTFSMGDFGPSTGHYTSYGCRIESSPGMIISKNKIYMLATNGQVVRAVILANTTSTKASPTQVNNNWIMNGGGTGDCTGLAVYNCRWVDFYYNNILITNSLKNGTAYYHYAAYTNFQVHIVNNILANVGGGYVYYVPGTNTSDISKIDYNDCYTNGSKFGQWNGTDYSNFSAWKSGSQNDTSSVNVDPGFNSYDDQHVSNISLNGKALPYSLVKDDIDGDPRSSTSPDIGADEFYPAVTDAGVSNLDSPAAFCAGANNVKIAFQNFGIDTLKSVSIGWSVNGTAQKTASWTGVVAPGSSGTLDLGKFTFVANTSYTFKIWTSSPNGKTDGKTVNDTLTLTKLPGLSGSYSIGKGSSYDYGSFNDAINDITARGLCGPTVINVADGIYKEQITLVELDGMSAKNTLTFQGASKDSTKVIVTLASTTATGNNNAALQLRGADYVTFKWVTFRRTGNNTYAQVIHILNGSNNNRFEHCRMIATKVTGVNLDGVNIWSNIGQDTGNVFLNNVIRHGTYNMQFLGTSIGYEKGTVIEGNVFDSAYSSAVIIGYNRGVIVRGNTFNDITNASAGSFDLQLIDCDSNINISKNHFNDKNTDYSIYLSDCQAKKTRPGKISNNFLSNKNGTGIYFDGAANHNVAFNSIYFRGTTTTNAAIGTSTASSSGLALLNNNIYMTVGNAYYIENKGQISVSNYNNFYVKGGQFAYWSGASYTNFAAYQTGSKQDSASFTTRPGFVSKTNLHSNNSLLNNAGIAVPGIKTDFDGDLRGSNPDIGADEFSPFPNDAGLTSITSPGLQTCEGNVDVTTVIKNFNSIDLKSITLNWTVSGVAQTPYKWSGVLKENQTDTVTLGTFSFKGGSKPTIVIWSSDPNGSTDPFTGNDSVSVSRTINPLPPANAGLDQAICIGDSVIIGSAGQSGYTYSWDMVGGSAPIGNVAKIYVKPTSATKYYVTVTRTTTGCEQRDTVEIDVNPLPAISAGTSNTICEGVYVQLGGPTTTGNSYDWSSDPIGFVSNASNPRVTPSQSTKYYLKQTIDATGCYNLDTVEITVLETPQALIVGDSFLCNDLVETYTTDLHPTSNYTWKVLGGNIISGQNSNTISIQWNTPGQTTLELIEASPSGCADTARHEIDVVANPVAMMSISGNCVLKELDFEDNSTDGETRTWDFGNGKNSTKKKTTNTYVTSGTYTVVLTVYNKGICMDSVHKTLNVVEPPVASFATDGSLCTDQQITFDNKSINAKTYSWDFGDGSTSTNNQESHSFATAKSYTVKLVANNDGCKDSAVTTIDISSTPESGFSMAVDGKKVSLTPDITIYDSYEWTFGDGTQSTVKNAKHDFDIVQGWAVITLTVKSAEGCTSSSTDSIYIDVIGIQELPEMIGYVTTYPNPFADNARLELQLKKDAELSVSIFDITGMKIGSMSRMNSAAGVVQFDIDAPSLGMKPGVYLIQIIVDNTAVVYQNIEVR